MRRNYPNTYLSLWNMLSLWSPGAMWKKRGAGDLMPSNALHAGTFPGSIITALAFVSLLHHLAPLDVHFDLLRLVECEVHGRHRLSGGFCEVDRQFLLRRVLGNGLQSDRVI